MIKNQFLIILLSAICAVSNTGVLYASSFYVDSVSGDDKNNGTSPKTPWKTLDKVNAYTLFKPGDKIRLKRGSIFRGELIPTVSGTADKPIVFNAYGRGINPEIRRTNEFSDWVEYSNTVETGKIWKGSLFPVVKNSAGATESTGNMNRINRYSPCISWKQLPEGFLAQNTCQVFNNPLDFPMEDQTFYAPLNSGTFFIRNDTGNPGKVEIGARRYAIYIDGVSNIIVENIDVFGPAGRDVNSCCSGFVPIKILNASNVTVKDLEIHGANGIGVSAEKMTTNDIYYSGLHAYDNGGTSIYLSSNGGHVINSRVHNNALLSKDIGDRGGIGSNGENLLIESNELYNNGIETDGYPDFEISIVGGTGPVTISNNLVYDCTQGCIQIAEGNDGSLISNNTIIGYATASGPISSSGKLSAIRIGGGSKGSKNVIIDNNYISNGSANARASDAGIHISGFDNSGIQITNNVFYNNKGSDIYVHYFAITNNAYIDYNSYQNSDFTANWNLKNNPINTLGDWQYQTGWDSNSDAVLINP